MQTSAVICIKKTTTMECKLLIAKATRMAVKSTFKISQLKIIIITIQEYSIIYVGYLCMISNFTNLQFSFYLTANEIIFLPAIRHK